MGLALFFCSLFCGLAAVAFARGGNNWAAGTFVVLAVLFLFASSDSSPSGDTNAET
jgi:hypothetical protein